MQNGDGLDIMSWLHWSTGLDSEALPQPQNMSEMSGEFSHSFPSTGSTTLAN